MRIFKKVAEPAAMDYPRTALCVSRGYYCFKHHPTYYYWLLVFMPRLWVKVVSQIQRYILTFILSDHFHASYPTVLKHPKFAITRPLPEYR